MKKLILTAAAAIILINVNAQKKVIASKKTSPVAVKPNVIFKNAIDSFSYAAGMNIGASLMQAGATKINSVLFTKALNDVYSKRKTDLTIEQAGTTLQQKLQEFTKKKTDAQKEEGQTFLNANKKRSGVTALVNGLQYEVIKAGELNGIKPKAIDTVVVNYAGTLINGTEFDNSFKRGQAASFPLNGVIKGWTEILQLMTKGAHWKVYIPGDLAYGEYPPQGSPISPNAVLIFEITLEDIKPAQPAATK
jgi:FKBP-type peptidyl-prolyl cis-trans isomerase FklB